MTTVHTLGDSHSRFSFDAVDFGGAIPFLATQKVVCHHVGPRLLHSFIRDRGAFAEEIINKAGHNTIFFVNFGEIDVRCHVHRYGETTQETTAMLKDMADKYVDTVEKIIVGNSVSRVAAICSVVPPSDQQENPSYPYLGTLADRIFYTKQLNEAIKTAVVEKNHKRLHFFDYGKHFALEDGSMNHMYSDGVVHINAPDELRKLLVPFLNNLSI